MNERPLIVRLRRPRPGRTRRGADAAPDARPEAARATLPEGAPPASAALLAPRRAPGDGSRNGASNWPVNDGAVERDILPAVLEAVERANASKEDLRIWSLVLLARRAPHRLERAGASARLWTPPRQAVRALREIVQYERENRLDGQPLPEPVFRDNGAVTMLVLACLALFYGISSTNWQFFGVWPAAPIDWVGRGSADAYAILIRGEWRRCLTALTLHADSAHLAANLVVGGWVFLPLMREAGSGLGWALILAAGCLGNYVNSLALGVNHNSLGASTAVFGAIGMLGALRGSREHGLSLRRALTPMAGAVALLAFLGAGDETFRGGRVDLGAHFFGFLAGLGLGAGFGLYCNKWGQPPEAVERLAAITAVIAPFAAWGLAFLR